MKTYHFHNCTFTVKPEDCYCQTTYKDGTVVAARPQPEQEQFALSLGYRNAWQMTVLHDLLHHAIAEAQGKPHSPALLAVAHGEAATIEHYNEEGTVLMVQKLLNRLQEMNLITIHYP